MSNDKNNHKEEGIGEKAVNYIAKFAGSMAFVYMHIIIFGVWIIINVYSFTTFDPYPFIFLTFVVSLEAIFLSTFVLINQNNDYKRSEKRAELDYAADRQTERDMHEVKKTVEEIKKILKKKK